jgi:serine/threonine-protein kinase
MRAGTLLGAYEILAPLGSGGMGEVYRARDTRLGREVAVKILFEDVASDAARRARFEREARAVAALNHPHIATLHDVGRAEGVDFLVMELVEGETLAERLKRGPLPIDQALIIAGQIADALDKAHRKGIVHRDLKPGNVMLTSEKHPDVKLLDFGLARLRQGFGGASPAESAPTAAQPLTQDGVLLGTLPYIPPEQLEGKDVDGRADLWALGAVLYEMLTGRRAFEGTSSAGLITAIMSQAPESVASLAPGIPRQLEHVLERCLAKDPDERWQTASDLLRELKWAETSARDSRPSSDGNPFAGRAGLVAAFLTLAGLLAGFAIRNVSSPAPHRTPLRLPLSTPRMTTMVRPAIAISRDGRRVAFVARDRIWVRDLTQLDARPVPGTEGAENPFFSPDGEWLGFFSGGRLQKTSLKGGLPVALLTDVFLPRGASWHADDTIVFSQRAHLMRIAAAGGTPELLVAAELASPQVLPGGGTLLYTLVENGTHKLVVRSLPAGDPHVLMEGAKGGRVLPTGHLVYFQSGTLYAARFDTRKLTLEGSSIPVVNDVRASRFSAHYDVSDNGTLLYWRGAAGARRFVWVDREGREEPLDLPPGDYNVVNLSPDGARFAFDDDSDVWVYDLSTATVGRFTFENSLDTDPVWSHDGARIFFSSERDGTRNVYWRPSDGSGEVTRLTKSASMQWPESVTPDGEVLFIDELGEETMNILQMNWRTESEPRPFLRTAGYERLPEASPDGRFVVYETLDASEREIYARTYPDGEGPWQVSNAGGRSPRWSPDGREIFYLEDGALIAVAVEREPSFRILGRRTLFEGLYADHTHSYDVSPDGKRFLMVKEEEASTGSGLVVVQDWFEELKRLVP